MKTLPEIRAEAKAWKERKIRESITACLDAGMSVAETADALKSDRGGLYRVMVEVGIDRPNINTRKLAKVLRPDELRDFEALKENGYRVGEALETIGRADLAARVHRNRVSA